MDDKKYFTFRNESTGKDVWPFDEPQYLLLNIAVGGDWGGQRGIDDTIWPQQLVVDYVRVFRHREATKQDARCPDTIAIFSRTGGAAGYDIHRLLARQLRAGLR